MKSIFFALMVLSGTLAAKPTRDMNLTWITVDDLNQAIEFYSKTVGLKAVDVYPEMGWAEMEGTGGARLGLAQAQEGMKAGSNAVFTITVKNIEATSRQMARRGATRCGDVMEVPGICKLQLFVDKDGNQFQLHQDLG